MPWYALENIEEALQDSKELLLPFDLIMWVKLAVIILLTGYVAAPSFPSVPISDINQDIDTTTSTNVPEYSSSNLFDISESSINTQLTTMDLGFGFALLAIIGLISGIIVFLTYITSVFEFVMYKSLIDEDVRLGHAFDYLFEGIQYFIFRWITSIALILTILSGIMVAITANLSFTVTGVLTGLSISIITIAIIAVISLLRWLVFNFSLLNMIEQENNLLTAFSRTLSAVKNEVSQVALFWAVKLLIGFILSIAVAAVLVPALLFALIPFAAIGFLLALIHPLLAVPIALIYIILAILVILAIAVPIRVYLYYYIIEMYQDIF